MHLDARDLKSFYLRTRLGRSARTSVRSAVLHLWPAEGVEGQTVLGFGFATPLLRPYLEPSRRTIALMPGQQGVIAWPPNAANVSVLGEENAWPVDTGSVDRLILLHGLETSETPSGVLTECNRVLGPGGKALFIVPNRAGLWARRDVTPFGYGRPYSLSQLEGQLKGHGFIPERHLGALFQPPSQKRFWIRTGPAWERVGRRLPSSLAGGVIIVEATKHVYAPTRGGLTEAIKAPLEALGGLAKPAPKPVSQKTRQVSRESHPKGKT